jgi:hypothetical protein
MPALEQRDVGYQRVLGSTREYSAREYSACTEYSAREYQEEYQEVSESTREY